MANLPDFDWDVISKKGIGAGYTAADHDAQARMYEATFNPVAEKEIVKALVVGMTDREVLLNEIGRAHV